jgi:Bifunctional DNA primase/polymerase, N-terminal
MSTFAKWQPIYAAVGIPTFPVTADKTPATRGYLDTGLRGSAELARKFADADAFGFACGPRSKITLVDIDSNDERALADALKTHGHTPLISRTASGGFHAWYRHNGEGRRIRPVPDKPLDILGGGFAVAPPSRVAKGCYEFIDGQLDDLGRLPTMIATYDHALPITARFPALTPSFQRGATGRVPSGQRNDALLRHCLRHADHCDDLDAMADVARAFVAMKCEVSTTHPMTDAEVFETAKSAWKMQVEGRNWFVRPRVQTPHDIIDSLAAAYPEAMSLLLILKRYHGGNETFVLAKEMAKKLGWTLPLWRRARDRLVASGLIRCIHRGGRGKNDPPKYAWTKGVRFHAPI